MMTLESLPRAYAPAEVEAITRFILRDQPVRITSGEWWGYSPDGAILTYPRFVLSLWPGDRVVGAVCHEVAEALFSGPDAARVFEEFGRRAARLGCETRSAELLLNAINDLRVNRLYLAAYPGSAPFLRAVYASGTELHRKDDQPAAQPGAVVMPHHQFVDALTCRWAREQWGLEAPKPTLDPVQRALDQCWPAIRLAIAQDALASLADRVADSVLATYHALIRLGQEMLAEAARRAAEAPEEEPEPRSESDDEEAPEDERFVVPEEPVEVWVHLDEDQTTEGERKRDNERESGRSPSPQPPAPNPQSPTPAPAWQLGVIPRFRRMRSRRAAVDYEQFDYIAAVRRLESQIAAIVEGRDGRPGLAAILTMRRFGTLDPWRRPRRFRRGDTGEIDGDHPENLLVDPSIAFLRGLRRHRDEGQKDFANVILLDVSGSVVQRGYPSRKFDQVVDTMVVFCEVHERLKLPYQLMCFSETPTVLRSFAECRYESLYLDPTSAHVIKDFSELVRQMYLLEHTETLDASALRQALASAGAQRGLKTILVVTDGISSDRSELWSTLGEIETRNELVPVGERLQVLAFGVGLAEQEFRASYEPVVHGHRLRCSRGRPVRDFDLLPAIVCDVVEERIRTA